MFLSKIWLMVSACVSGCLLGMAGSGSSTPIIITSSSSVVGRDWGCSVVGWEVGCVDPCFGSVYVVAVKEAASFVRRNSSGVADRCSMYCSRLSSVRVGLICYQAAV